MEPFIGQIQPFGFNFAPRGWAQCDGQLLQISQFSALFSLLGTTYGGDGRTTFGLPDLRGRTSLHQGQGPGLSNRPMGQRSGNQDSILNTNNMPAHTHVQLGSEEDASTGDPGGNVCATTGGNNYHTPADGTTGMGNTSSAGANTSFSNMPPYLVINWCIALQGTFPSRN